jgi:RNA polymerase sigma-70 factor (ECF subfamily)
MMKPGRNEHEGEMPLQPIAHRRDEYAVVLGRSPSKTELQIPNDKQNKIIPEAQLLSLYDDYLDFVWRSLRRLGVFAADLDDATQDVFVVVHRRLSEFEERSSLKSWIFAIALRVAKAYLRKRATSRARTADSEVELVCSEGNPEDEHANRQMIEVVLSIVHQLEEDRRAVFVLAELEHMPVAEISEALGVPINTVYSRLRLAREDFQAAFKRYRAKDEWRYR